MGSVGKGKDEAMKYRENMSEAELAEFKAEILALDAAYAEQPPDEPWTEEGEAEYEQSLEYFDRYIAGDRK
jgi:hypothetical protein